MSLRREKELSSPEAQGVWDSFQKEIIPHLLSVLPDELFTAGREQELFVALNQALLDKYEADGAVIPRDIQYRKQLDICHLMPVFAKVKNPEELIKPVFEKNKSTQSKAFATGPLQPPSGKIVTLADAPTFRAALRARGRKVVATNGCFDLLHVGHLRYLTEARPFGDFLWVGLNGDASVRELKGANRPIVPEQDRAQMLAALRVVDAVTIFPEVRATSFLTAVQPDFYVKGGDYTVASLNAEEATALRECNAQIEIVNLVPGKSTTSLVQKMAT
jgi:D-glycero-beta-D-manno-heptose 1-phosphate adenylyltransferase